MSTIGALERALATGGGPPVVWLAAANCTGCTVSLANRFSSSAPARDVGDLLINTIHLAYHPNLMGAAGESAVDVLRDATTGDFILAVEGGIPTAFDGHACILWSENGRDVTAMEAVMQLAPRAKAVLSIGTCSSYGGIPSANPNPTGVKSVAALTGVKTINIPGCPSHPDWIVWTIAQLLANKIPSLDSTGRPKTLFATTIHDKCSRRGKEWALSPGEEGKCLRGLGCKGPNTRADCATRLWNSGNNWCVGANSLCLGCTETGFPDRFSPFYSSAGALPAGHKKVDTTKTCNQCHKGGKIDD